MKNRWKNNLGLKIVAALFAIFLWWAVVNIDDPIQTKDFTTDVILMNTDVVTNAGMSYQIVDSREITVSVKARRKVLKEMRASDILATADFKEINEATQLVPIRVEIKDRDYKEAIANPRNLQIKMEVTETKTFPISVEVYGAVREGYTVDEVNTTTTPNLIEISGPKSVLGRIQKVAAVVDVSELNEDATLTGKLVYYDSAGNKLDKSMLSSNCDRHGVTVDVKVLTIKELEIRFDTSEIKMPEGYTLVGIEVEPKTIKVAGKKDDLKAMAYLNIESKALNQEVTPDKKEIVVENIAEYLPDNLVLAEEAAGKVAVSILMEKSGVKALDLPVRAIRIDNLSEGYEADYGDLVTVTLQFSGTEEGLQKISSESILAVIDMTEFKTGTFSVPVKVIEMPEQCTYLGKTNVEITVKKKG